MCVHGVNLSQIDPDHSYLVDVLMRGLPADVADAARFEISQSVPLQEDSFLRVYVYNYFGIASVTEPSIGYLDAGE